MSSTKDLKKSKRQLNTAITRALTDLDVKLSEEETDWESIKGILARIEDKKENALAIMEDLQLQLEKEKRSDETNKISDEADLLNDREDQETSQARSFWPLQAAFRRQWSLMEH